MARDLTCLAKLVTDPVSKNLPAGIALPGEGVTEAERYLAELCKRTFLSLWSYPRVFKDQGKPKDKGEGKELCDLLVVFENHILIFSDKDCRFNDAIDLSLAWSRWFKKTVQKSAEQVWGAERWIKNFPTRLFLDSRCLVPFPINLPDPKRTIFHRIVVAHDASRACRAKLGGSGSLMLDNSLVGDAHLEMPFTIGQIDPAKGYIHVFDDTTLDIVMDTLDTITDFTTYLTKKERFLSGKRFVRAAGEEELLAVYFRGMNRKGEHDFVFDGKYDVLMFPEGFWDEFTGSPERQAQIESDKISYTWDDLIEKFAFHAMSGTQYFTSGKPLREQEVVFRFLARESRTRRRSLAISLHETLEKSIEAPMLSARVMQPTEGESLYYVFLFLKCKPGATADEYRSVRKNLLANYCLVTKLVHPDAQHIIGIASEAGLPPQRSEDLIYLDVTRWSSADQARAKQIQEEFGLLRKVKVHRAREYEYPVDHKGKPRRPNLSRNSPCPCGSGKRFKRCHGAGSFDKG